MPETVAVHPAGGHYLITATTDSIAQHQGCNGVPPDVTNSRPPSLTVVALVVPPEETVSNPLAGRYPIRSPRWSCRRRKPPAVHRHSPSQ